MTNTNTDAEQQRRYGRLRLLVDNESHVHSDCDAEQALLAREQGEAWDLKRFAATSYDHRPDCWISLHHTRDDAATYLAGEAQGECPMAPGDILDLDTGEGWAVVLAPLVTAWSGRGATRYAEAASGDPQ